MRASGILFADGTEAERIPFTLRRSQAALPFGCRYRLADFPLSCMARAGITHISVAAAYAFNSLLEHIGSGKAWESARHNGGIRLVSPYRYGRGGRFHGRLGALVYMLETLEATPSEYILTADCDTITNPDASAMLAEHRASGAAVTLLAAEECSPVLPRGLYLKADRSGHILDAHIGERHVGDCLFLGMAVFTKKHLLPLVRRATGGEEGDILRAIFLPLLLSGQGCVFFDRLPFARVAELLAYYQSSMRLLHDRSLRSALIENSARPILTGNRPTPPTVYGREACAENSLVAEGCRIEGRVEGSLLFRGVRVGRGSCVRNSVLLGGCTVGENTKMEAVCADKGCAIRDGRLLLGHPLAPLFIEQGKVI